MPDQTVPVPYPNSTATTTHPVDTDRQPPHTQTTHPSTSAHEPQPASEPNRENGQV